MFIAEHIQGITEQITPCGSVLPQDFMTGCRDCVPAGGYKGRGAPCQGLGQSPNIYALTELYRAIKLCMEDKESTNTEAARGTVLCGHAPLKKYNL